MKAGDKAVVSKWDDTQVYTVAELLEDGLLAKLTYKRSGVVYSGGAPYPVSCLKKPTARQLNNKTHE